MTPARRAWFDLYIGHFASHDEAYVRQDVGGSKWTVHEPLTAEVVMEAFSGGRYSVSGFLARARDGLIETHVGAIDFDTDDGLEQAEATCHLLADMGIGSLLVGSRRGAHLWAHAEGVIPAAIMRRALHNALVLQGLDEPKIEVFPKRSGTPMGGGALRMPLMRHPGTGLRYPARTPWGVLLTRLADVVSQAVEQTSPPEALYALAGPDPMETPYPRWNDVYGPLRRSQDDPGATSLLASLGLPAQPGRSVRCAFHDDRHASLSVSADDQRVWCKAPACRLYNDGRGVGSRDLARLLDEGPPAIGATHAQPSHQVHP